MDDFEEEFFEDDVNCPFCSGKGWYKSDGWPVHCEHCDSVCDERCPACLVAGEDCYDTEPWLYGDDE